MIGVPVPEKQSDPQRGRSVRVFNKPADYSMNVPPAERRQELADTLPSEQTTCTSA
jgi:hypothetical protein